jgi:hypothetical protein
MPRWRGVSSQYCWRAFRAKKNIKRTRREAERLVAENLSRQQERDAERKQAVVAL